jgi:hypothetical protein
MAADRGAYIDQSQSFNAHMGDINYGKLTSMHFYGWKKVSAIFIQTRSFRHVIMINTIVRVNVISCKAR